MINVKLNSNFGCSLWVTVDCTWLRVAIFMQAQSGQNADFNKLRLGVCCPFFRNKILKKNYIFTTFSSGHLENM